MSLYPDDLVVHADHGPGRVVAAVGHRRYMVRFDDGSLRGADEALLTEREPAPERGVLGTGPDNWQPTQDELHGWTGDDELADGLGGWLRVAPQSPRDEALDDVYLLAGEELYLNRDGLADVVDLETEGEARRRRDLLETLQGYELPDWVR